MDALPPTRSRRGLIARVTLGIILALVGVAIGVIWFVLERQRQDRYLATAAVLLAGYALFLVWVLFASGWRPRVRWTLFLGTILVVVFCATTLRIRGVTGDLMPIVEWRWQGAKVSPARGVGAGVPATNAIAAFSNNYPQFLGSNRDGTLPGPSLETDWSKAPPQELWRGLVGSAWSGFAIVGPRAVTQEQHGEEERVVCYETLTGKVLWSHADKSRYATTIAGEGPRATPTIAAGRVYTMGGAGILNCLDLASGKMIWRRDTLREHGAKLPEWGMASSPLVTERAVIVSVGGRNSALVAHDPNSGAVLWASGQDDVHWSSPIRVLLHDVPQVLIFSENVSSYDEATGRVLWQYPWRNPYPHVSVPLVLASNRVLVSQGYGTGSELLEVKRDGERWKAERIWKSIRMKSKFGTLIHLDGFVYGLDDGAMACIEVATGDLKWKGDRFGHGQMILVGRLLLLMAENGDVVLLEPKPAEQRELARHKVFSSKTWNPPALVGDVLLVRNDREAVALRLPVRSWEIPTNSAEAVRR